ncbi:MAG: MCE family protein [Jatrophihabitans endophyticus]|nr:MCE family protein [Jatrophihabitans endophyticus]
MGKSFSQRNPLPIGIIGLVFLLVLLVAAFNAASLPLIGGGTEYTALFTESANLKADDEVRIAGIKAGKVEDVALDTQKGLVKVTFTIKDGWVGNDSTIDIKLKTLLGQKYLSINSSGTKAQDPSQTICDETPQHTCQRTTSPFDVYPAFTALTRTVGRINTKNLQGAFRTLASAFSGTPDSVRPLVRGLSRLSTTIASRDQKLQTLLANANTVTKTLADQDSRITALLRDGSLILDELNQRRDAIHSLLLNTVTLSQQLRGLVSDNDKTLGPLLDQLTSFTDLLEANQDSLDRGLALLGPFYRVFNNVIGNGQWFDNYICNISVQGVLGGITGSTQSGCPS